MEKKSVKWVWIVFWTAIFLPIGLVLGYRRLIKSKSFFNTLWFLFWVFEASYMIFLPVFIMIMSFTGDSEYTLDSTAIGFFSVPVGIIILKLIISSEKKSIREKKYKELVLINKNTNIDDIARFVNEKYDKVLFELNMLTITSNDFENLEVDREARRIKLKAENNNNSKLEIIKTQNSSKYNSQNIKYLEVKCESCGACTVGISGQVIVCEYCETKIIVQ